MTNRGKQRFWLFFCIGTLLLLNPAMALAHVEKGQAISFLTGIEHPWSGLDHILAMIAVGIWGAQLGNPALWALPVAFPMMMAVGGMMGLIGIPLPGVEFGIALSAIVLGLMVLLELHINLIITIIIVGFFAIFHGHAHGTELPAGQSGLLYSMGFVIGTGCLHGIGILLGMIHYYKLGRPLLRVAGAFIMVMGCIFLWQAAA